MGRPSVAQCLALALATVFFSFSLALLAWSLLPESRPLPTPMLGGLWGSRRLLFVTGPSAELVLRADGTGENLTVSLPLAPRFTYRATEEDLYVRAFGQEERVVPIRALTHDRLYLQFGDEVVSLERFTGQELKIALRNAENLRRASPGPER